MINNQYKAALKLPWYCPGIAPGLPLNYPSTSTKSVLISFWNCSETALKLLWNCSEKGWNWSNESDLKLLWNCSGIALKLLWNCSETALKLLWKNDKIGPMNPIICCSETALELLWNCLGIALKLLWNCSETGGGISVGQWRGTAAFGTRRRRPATRRHGAIQTTPNLISIG